MVCLPHQGTHPLQGGTSPTLWGGTSKQKIITHPRLPATQLREDTISWRGGPRSYRSTNMGPAKPQTNGKKSRSNQTKTERRYCAPLIATDIVSDETWNRHARRLLESFINCVCIRGQCIQKRRSSQENLGAARTWTSQV